MPLVHDARHSRAMTALRAYDLAATPLDDAAYGGYDGAAQNWRTASLGFSIAAIGGVIKSRSDEVIKRRSREVIARQSRASWRASALPAAM